MNYRHIQVDPVTPTIGAMISGVDLNHVRSEDVYEEIQQALWAHGVVFFRKQPLTPEAHVRLARQFGEVEKHEFFPHIKGVPEIQLIAHEGYESPETDRWHTDVTFRKKPSMVCALRITDIPPNGGDTMWASTAAAFDALGEPMQQLLMGLQAEHDMPFHFRRVNAYEKLAKRQADADKRAGAMMNTMGSSEELNAALADRECKMIKDNPPVLHPAVITHPFNGRRLLFVNSIWTKRLLGVHMDLSEALLHMLAEWVKKPEFMVRFRWEKDSLVLWDNCQTQHYAVFDYAPHYRAGQRVTAGSFVPTLGGAQPAAATGMAASAPGAGLKRVLDTSRLQGASPQEKAAVDALFAALDNVDLGGVAARAHGRR
ncbi:taurine dioxygenase [Ramlibacter solisilvae]|uniref:TauD/TfdA dioxygenase family protein n=1 Tax=Ramlibacter tataouinensis TaxID=94132 RepID=UPI000777CCB0|nr:TauD/TfdA family dioxygenase [Ramlibacter tataouinensis]